MRHRTAILTIALMMNLTAAAQRQAADNIDVMMNAVAREFRENTYSAKTSTGEAMQQMLHQVDMGNTAQWRNDQQMRCLALMMHYTDRAANSADFQKRVKTLTNRLNTSIGEEQTALQLSRMFEEGLLVPENPRMAFSIVEKEAQKQSFPTEANYELACMLLDGYGCQPDAAKAISLLIKCAERGYKPALRELSLACKEQGLTIDNPYLQFLMREANHYDNLTRMDNGYVQAEKNGRHGIIDRQGKTIVSLIYDQPVWFNPQGITEVKQNGKYGYIDSHGNQILSPRYLAATSFSEGLAIVCDEQGWALIDENGNERLIDNFDAIRAFKGGRAIATKNNKKGAIDCTGQTAIPPQFDDMGDFACGLAAIRIGKKWGYADEKGKIVIPCRYDSALPFVNPQRPFALVTLKGKQICIDKRGKKTKPE